MALSPLLRIESYLKLGYFIDYRGDDCPIDFGRVDRERLARMGEPELLAGALAALRSTFAAQFQPGREHVVPLSGGLDSRLIVAALRELTEARNIHTLTFGVPGSYDYDIGCHVAKHAGTRHTALAQDGFSHDWDELNDRSRRMSAQVSVFFSPPIWQMARLFGGAVFWSGYVGDAIAGSYVYPQPSQTVREAKLRYLKRRTIIRSQPLHRVPDEDLVEHVTGGEPDPGRLTFDEQVLFAEGVRKFTTPIVLMKGFEYRTPFINSPWMDYMMSLPRSARLDEALLLQLSASAYPDLFSLPTKMYYGVGPVLRRERVLATRVVNRVRKLGKRRLPFLGYPPVLYNDFDERFRDSPDLMSIARECLDALKRRGVVDWLNLEELWQRHQARRINIGDALAILTSLEINLRTQESTERANSSPSV